MAKLDIIAVFRILKKETLSYDVPVVELIKSRTNDPFKILVSTILSARTKDETTSEVCRRLFKVVKKVKDLEKLSVNQIEKLIYPVGFYRNKARYLKELPGALRDKFNGKIPATVDELVQLPGVGRKTANLVSAVAFQKDAICVDIHVHRIMNRLGYVETKTPQETERALRDKLPKRMWKTVNRIFVAFGQNLCRPVSPHCSRCPVDRYCNRNGVTKFR